MARDGRMYADGGKNCYECITVPRTIGGQSDLLLVVYYRWGEIGDTSGTIGYSNAECFTRLRCTSAVESIESNTLQYLRGKNLKTLAKKVGDKSEIFKNIHVIRLLVKGYVK